MLALSCAFNPGVDTALAATHILDALEAARYRGDIGQATSAYPSEGVSVRIARGQVHGVLAAYYQRTPALMHSIKPASDPCLLTPGLPRIQRSLHRKKQDSIISGVPDVQVTQLLMLLGCACSGARKIRAMAIHTLLVDYVFNVRRETRQRSTVDQANQGYGNGQHNGYPVGPKYESRCYLGRNTPAHQHTNNTTTQRNNSIPVAMCPADARRLSPPRSRSVQ